MLIGKSVFAINMGGHRPALDKTLPMVLCFQARIIMGYHKAGSDGWSTQWRNNDWLWKHIPSSRFYMNMDLIIHESNSADLESLLAVERAAFGSEEEAELVRNLLNDPSAEPRLSLLALQKQQAVGHILFTRGYLNPEIDLKVSILAPLAVIPEYQKQGVGGSLIREGLATLEEDGVDLVFVLGHPSYYPLHGFKPAVSAGFEPPYYIPPEFTDAWMVQALKPTSRGSYKGQVKCAETLDRPEYWGE